MCEIKSGRNRIKINPRAFEIARDLQTMTKTDVAKKYGLTVSCVSGFAQVIADRKTLSKQREEVYAFIVKRIRSGEPTTKSSLRAVLSPPTYLYVRSRLKRDGLYKRLVNVPDVRERVIKLANSALSPGELAFFAGASRQYVYMLEEEGAIPKLRNNYLRPQINEIMKCCRKKSS